MGLIAGPVSLCHIRRRFPSHTAGRHLPNIHRYQSDFFCYTLNLLCSLHVALFPNMAFQFGALKNQPPFGFLKSTSWKEVGVQAKLSAEGSTPRGNSSETKKKAEGKPDNLPHSLPGEHMWIFVRDLWNGPTLDLGGSKQMMGAVALSPPCIYVFAGRWWTETPRGLSVSAGLNIKGCSWIFAPACKDCKTGHSLPEDMSMRAWRVSSLSGNKSRVRTQWQVQESPLAPRDGFVCCFVISPS